MKIAIVWIGKTTESWIEEGINEYLSRLKHYITVETKEFGAIKKNSNFTEIQIKQKESDLLLSFIQPGDVLVLLDENGKMMRSRDFSQYIDKQMVGSVKRLVFMIGGAYGFSDEVYQKSQSKLSLSKMTYSHQMVRVIFHEQLYRAMTILKGEPYHHD
jgi:23S rRNA (pseudouridine1915-N3)-methyltransferase